MASRASQKPFIKSTILERNALGNLQPFIVQLTSSNVLDVKDDAVWPEHIHEICEIITVREGAYEAEVNGERLRIEKGDMLLIQPTDAHTDFYLHDSKLLFMVFSTYDLSGRRWTRGFLSEKAPVSSRLFKGDANPVLAGLLSLFESDSIDAKAKLCICEATFWQILGSFPPEMQDPDYRAQLERGDFQCRVMDYFQRKLNLDMNIKELALELNMSKRALEYKFRQHFKESPAHAFLACKMRLAVHLLEQGFDVKAVASQLGFSSQFYFSTAFKRLMGYPPSHTTTGCGKAGRVLRKIE